GCPAHHRRRVGPGALRGLPCRGADVQDRLGKAKGRPSMTTPRIRALTPEQAAPEVRPILEAYLKERGNIPNMFRTVALRPSHLRTMIAHFRTVMNEGTVPPLLKELLWVRVSHLNSCRYCLSSHTVLARRRGASEALLSALQGAGAGDALDALEPGWRAALTYAD